MSRVHAIVRRAQRRRMLARFVRAAGLALTVGGGAAVALVVTDRVLSLEFPNWMLIGVPCLGALAGAALWAALTPRRPLQTAADIDHALELDDRLGSAMALHARSKDDPFAALAVEEGERIAPEVRVNLATPIVFGGVWWAWPVVLAVAIASAIFLPAFDLAQRRQQEAQQAEQTAARQRAADDVAEARAVVAPDETEMADLATPTDLQTLEELERQLAAGEVDPDAARAKAAGALNNAANELDRDAQRQEQSLDALREQFQGLNAADEATPSPLSKALSDGDFGQAQQLLEDYQRQLEELDEAERRAIADELEQLSESIESPSADDVTPGAAEQSLRDLGVADETIDQLRDETNPEPIRDALREEGVDEPIAETLADRLAEENRQRQAEEQARRDAQELKDALRDAAEQTRDPKPQEPPQPPAGETPPNDGASQDQPNQPAEAPSQQQPSSPEREGEPAREEDSTQPGQQQQPSSAPQQQPQEQPGEQSSPPSEPQPQQQPQPGAPESPSGEQRQSPQPTPGEGGEQRQPEPAPTPEQSPGSAPEKPQEGEPTPDQQAPPTGVPNQPTTPSGQPQPQPASPDQSQPPTGEAPSPQQSPDGAPQPSPSGAESDRPSPLNNEGSGAGSNEPGLERARRKLEELKNRQQGAREQRESAEEARRKAREMLDRMTPEQREQFERWARELERERPSQPPVTRPNPGEFARDPVDMRPQEPAPDRVIAQWFNPDAKPGDPSDVSRRAVGDQLQDAARGAERAVEDQAVHRRYSDIIKRYFENARKSAPAPSEPGGE